MGAVRARPARPVRMLLAFVCIWAALAPNLIWPKGASADSFGSILVPGWQWAGGYSQLGDLNVYSNGTRSQDQWGTFGWKYECVELAQRWAYYRFGETPVWSIQNAADMWNVGPTMKVPFLQNPNGGLSPPQFGDLIIFGSTSYDPTGHVAVVTSATLTTVNIVEQNWSNSVGAASLPISGTYMPPRWGLTIRGWLRASAPASLGGVPVEGTPHMVSSQPGEREVFWRGSDGSLWHRWYSNGTWYGPYVIPQMGPMQSDPYPVSRGDGHIDVFWRGTDNGLWRAYWDGTGWHGPQWLGGNPLASDPQVVEAAAGHIDVYWKGTDGSLWNASYSSGAWRPPSYLAEQGLASAPHAISTSSGTIDVVWKGTDQNLWHKYFDGTQWTPAVSVGDGPLGGDPYPVSWGPGNLDVFWKGNDADSIWHAWPGSGGTWSAATYVAHGTQTDPTPISTGPTNYEVFWVDPSFHIIQATYQYVWTSPVDLGDAPANSAITAASWNPGHYDAIWVGSDQGLWDASY
jgi:CHAP domain